MGVQDFDQSYIDPAPGPTPPYSSYPNASHESYQQPPFTHTGETSEGYQPPPVYWLLLTLFKAAGKDGILVLCIHFSGWGLCLLWNCESATTKIAGCACICIGFWDSLLFSTIFKTCFLQKKKNAVSFVGTGSLLCDLQGILIAETVLTTWSYYCCS